MRASGEPYIVPSPGSRRDPEPICAWTRLDLRRLLHDSVEDTPAPTSRLRSVSTQVARIVEGVTNIDRSIRQSRGRQAENVRKCCWHGLRCARRLSSNSPTACTICAPWSTSARAPRGHRPRNPRHLRPARPRLGMGKIAVELEDLAFRYTDPVSYEQVSAAVEVRRIEANSSCAASKTPSTSNCAKTTSRPASSGHQAHLFHLPEAAALQSLLRPVTICWHVASYTQDVAPVRRLRPHPHALAAPCRGASKTSSPCPAPPLPVAPHHV